MSKKQQPPQEKPSDCALSEGKKMDRRTFLRAGLAAGIMAGAGMIAGCAIPFVGKSGNSSADEPDDEHGSTPEAAQPAAAEPSSQTPEAAQTPASAAYPFKLGVASGDPLPDGIVLWTRLVPNIRDAKGGMPNNPVAVKWEMAKDDKFQKIVKSGTETAIPELAHSIHAEVDGLEPATTYYYKFTAGNDVSPVGRTKTAPALDAKLDRFNYAFASCQHYSNGYYTAYDHLVKEDIDLVVFLGDYIYEGATPKEAGNLVKGREHYPNRSLSTLADYRLRYSQYKADPSLQAAHAAFPWIVTFDDHEVKNNWGGAGFPNNPKHPSLMQWRTAAFQAYYEHMPLRKAALPNGPDMLLYRRLRFGDLAEFSVLDTRQYRAGFPCQAETTLNCDERYKYSMIGDTQEKWLLDGLAASKARWNILANQVLMATIKRKEGIPTGNWSGYLATRDRLRDQILNHNISNVIVITGDSHNNWLNLLYEDFDDAKSRIWGVEFAGTSISSGGNGTDMSAGDRDEMERNPDVIKFHNGQRGYIVCELTPDQYKSSYRVLSYIKRKGSPITTRASFVVKNGKPGVEKV